VLKEGGWGFASFNDPALLEKYAELALKQAELVQGTRFSLAPVKPHVSAYRSPVAIDPASIPLSEKQQLCHRYNQILLADERIRTSVVRYQDSHAKWYFANSEGSFIEQEYRFCGMTVAAIAVDGANIQRAYEAVGDLRGYGNVVGLEEACERIKKRALDLLKAQPIEGGVYTVILDPKLCGVFAHEAFGHLSEGDFLYENPRMRDIMKLGRRFGKETLNITDDGSLDGEAGFVAFDSEGVPSQRTPLIKNGVLVGRLHNRETASKMSEQPTGNARAISHEYPPIVRMTNTFMEPGERTFEQMLEETEDGIYAIGMLGGQTDM
jgi:TldD protein